MSSESCWKSKMSIKRVTSHLSDPGLLCREGSVKTTGGTVAASVELHAGSIEGILCGRGKRLALLHGAQE